MVENPTPPAEPELPAIKTETFTLPAATQERIAVLFQQRLLLDQRIGDMIQAVMDEKGLVSATPPDCEVGAGVVTYTPALTPVAMPNRAQRRRITRRGKGHDGNA